MINNTLAHLEIRSDVQNSELPFKYCNKLFVLRYCPPLMIYDTATMVPMVVHEGIAGSIWDYYSEIDTFTIAELSRNNITNKDNKINVIGMQV